MLFYRSMLYIKKINSLIRKNNTLLEFNAPLMIITLLKTNTSSEDQNSSKIYLEMNTLQKINVLLKIQVILSSMQLLLKAPRFTTL